MKEVNNDQSRKNREIKANNVLTSETFDLNPVERIRLLENIYGRTENSQTLQIKNQIQQSCTEPTPNKSEFIPLKIKHRRNKRNRH